jgi:hypothetical protein
VIYNGDIDVLNKYCSISLSTEFAMTGTFSTHAIPRQQNMVLEGQFELHLSFEQLSLN